MKPGNTRLLVSKSHLANQPIPLGQGLDWEVYLGKASAGLVALTQYGQYPGVSLINNSGILRNKKNLQGGKLLTCNNILFELHYEEEKNVI